jgi:hypothetical protein
MARFLSVAERATVSPGDPTTSSPWQRNRFDSYADSYRGEYRRTVKNADLEDLASTSSFPNSHERS